MPQFGADVYWQRLLKSDGKQGRVVIFKRLHEGQCGSRPGKQATTLPLFEELRTDISYLKRSPLINIDNDADSCFDRIVVTLASLISRKYGVHRNITFINGSLYVFEDESNMLVFIKE